MTSLCTCIGCALVPRLSSLLLLNTKARTQSCQHKEDRVDSDFLWWVFVCVFRKRKTRKASCWCWNDVGDCCCCFRSFNAPLRDAQILSRFNPPSLVLLPSTRLPSPFLSVVLSRFSYASLPLPVSLSPVRAARALVSALFFFSLLE